MRVAAWPISLVSSSPGCWSSHRSALHSFSTCCVSSTPSSGMPQPVNLWTSPTPINCWEPLPWTGCAIVPTGWSWIGKAIAHPDRCRRGQREGSVRTAPKTKLSPNSSLSKCNTGKLGAPAYVWTKHEFLASARTCGQPMDNIHVAHRLTTLIHPLTTLRRAGPAAN